MCWDALRRSFVGHTTPVKLCGRDALCRGFVEHSTPVKLYGRNALRKTFTEYTVGKLRWVICNKQETFAEHNASVK